MQLFKSAVIDVPDARTVEMVFTDGSEPDPAKEALSFRVAANAEGSPRIPEAYLEALHSARNVIDDEIHRLELVGGRDD